MFIKKKVFISVILVVSIVSVGQCDDVRAKNRKDESGVQRPLQVGVECVATQPVRSQPATQSIRPFRPVACEGTYQHHLQGICAGAQAIYWSFTTQLVKTDLDGRIVKKMSVTNHHGDLCFHDGKIYVAVNLGKFNDPKGNADSWVYVYKASDLSFVSKHETQEVFYGAGGIGCRNGHFFIVGGLPDDVQENYVYEYGADFRFVKKIVIKSGHTLMGIQTATFANGRWFFGCYGKPSTLLVTDADFRMKGRYAYDCSLGIEGLSDGRMLSASGRCQPKVGCTGKIGIAVPDEKSGLRKIEILK